ncbi:MAG: RNase adapter RapZ [Spirochaetales bacterium]|jgi:UPF0042 nucleotide-binding protein|nr:RNase adapter RapZ [Spirochaetales bacterium]
MGQPTLPPTILITGLAGSGKSTALNVFEDMGYYCIDNLPCFLIDDLMQKTHTGSKQIEKLALVMDGRDPSFFYSFKTTLTVLKQARGEVTTFFLTAKDDVLTRRFIQMRRNHPYAEDLTLSKAISLERQRFEEIQADNQHIIDTSTVTPTILRNTLLKICGVSTNDQPLPVTLTSFGFKHGVPSDVDLVWDVRFLPNPYFETSLRNRTGKNLDVANYALANATGERFFKHLSPLLDFLIPEYQRGGKVSLTIGVGCTGGKHRSVAVVERLKEIIAHFKVNIHVSHRDIGKE